MSELIGAAVPRSDSIDALLSDVRRAFGVGHAFALCSGKAALTTVLLAMRALTGRRKVILPAYTCYSVPSAIVKAGLEPVPCDLAPGSFDYDYAQLHSLLDSDVLCALSVHLFGIPADTRRLVALCRPMGIFVVEDAAQAMDVAADGHPPLGTRGDAGVFSFGRGKNITSGSGGLIIGNSRPIAAGIAAILKRLPRTGARDGAAAFAGLALQSLLISPRLYWFPAGLPFLRLGETIFHEDFPLRELSPLQARLLRGWRTRLDQLNRARRQIASHYLRHIHGAREFGKRIAYLRFPLLLDPEARRRVLIEDASRRLGITGMYPATVGRIPELQARLTEKVFPRAEELAARVLTLPTHSLLTRGDLESICRLVNATAAAASRPAGLESAPDALAAVHH
jgi:dTDP-4-amino-4,6-dideoxygalactose transaminase